MLSNTKQNGAAPDELSYSGTLNIMFACQGFSKNTSGLQQCSWPPIRCCMYTPIVALENVPFHEIYLAGSHLIVTKREKDNDDTRSR